MNKSKNTYTLSILAAGCLWGFMGLFRRYMGEAGFSSSGVIVLRCGVAALCFALTLLLTGPSQFRVRLRDAWCFFGSGVVSLLFFTFCYFQAMNYMSLSAAAILLYTAPAIVTLLSALLFKERLTGLKLLAVLLAFLGCALVSGLGAGDMPFRRRAYSTASARASATPCTASSPATPGARLFQQHDKLLFLPAGRPGRGAHLGRGRRLRDGGGLRREPGPRHRRGRRHLLPAYPALYPRPHGHGDGPRLHHGLRRACRGHHRRRSVFHERMGLLSYCGVVLVLSAVVLLNDGPSAGFDLFTFMWYHVSNPVGYERTRQ